MQTIAAACVQHVYSPATLGSADMPWLCATGQYSYFTGTRRACRASHCILLHVPHCDHALLHNANTVHELLKLLAPHWTDFSCPSCWRNLLLQEHLGRRAYRVSMSQLAWMLKHLANLSEPGCCCSWRAGLTAGQQAGPWCLIERAAPLCDARRMCILWASVPAHTHLMPPQIAWHHRRGHWSCGAVGDCRSSSPAHADRPAPGDHPRHHLHRHWRRLH